MKYAYRLGKAVMLPVACLPVAGLLMGVGFWLDPVGQGENLLLAHVMILAGSVLIDNMSLLFTLGVAVGLADEQDGTAALAGVISWLMIQKILSPDNVVILTGNRVDASSFSYINNQFVGILSGWIGAYCCNKYRFKVFHGPLQIYGGRVYALMMATIYAALASIMLLFAWPYLHSACLYVGESLIGTGALGAGVYGFLNRLLIPTGFHHVLNSVFWFDLAGIADLNSFWNGTGVYGQTGMYMTGYFPVMIFGLPGAALAMYHTAYPAQKKMAAGLLLTASLCSVLTGVTEPLEFAFMFLAPGLFLLHAILMGISMYICAALPFRIGFNFSAGLMDYFMCLNAPMTQNPGLLLPVGLLFGLLYYIVFRFCILHFHLKTPGREASEKENEKK
ncbi:PTS glucose transporter subunit IIBC [Clostridiaceae bacterium AM27-36LB]|nr:PTS glucose transporter subunit IIBC [Clostridiales bacterium AM23-16LB]RHR45167.1 PTS glucose transporter subunit IIBC [Clostridiaceae bacterium AF18-31LB]RHT83948.1 PTS glucose transporter subunit IIBC [Clostridiaceae bacterium AM27-36LB]RHW05004.1 PTS glucose transporter subunit IIBC [Clostridiaceae bacterium OF09-1]